MEKQSIRKDGFISMGFLEMGKQMTKDKPQSTRYFNRVGRELSPIEILPEGKKRRYKWKQATIKDLDMVRVVGACELARLWIARGIVICGLKGLTDPKFRKPYRMRKNVRAMSVTIWQRQYICDKR